jgi:hypothetical protein
MRIRNLTPHPVNVIRDDGPNITYPVDGPAPRVTMIETPDGTVHDDEHDIDIECVTSTTSDVITGLPYYEPDILLIVSRMVCDAARHLPEIRTDLVYPEGIVRSVAGTITGCTKLGRVRR